LPRFAAAPRLKTHFLIPFHWSVAKMGKRFDSDFDFPEIEYEETDMLSVVMEILALHNLFKDSW